MPIEEIKALLEETAEPGPEVAAKINDLDPYELARRLHELDPEEKVCLFGLLDSDEKRQTLLYETDPDSRMEIQDSLEPVALARLLEDMPEDEAADILQEHTQESRDEILEQMEPRDAGTIKDLITYEEETAGGLMTIRFNEVRGNPTAADILMSIKRDSNQDIPPYFYLVDENRRLKGYFKLRDLLNVPAQARALDFVQSTTPKVLLGDTCEKVANLMDHEQLSTIPVVDENDVMHGIITFDDVIRTMQDLASEDIFTMVGTAKVDPFAKSIGGKITARAPWLFTTFIGGLASASIIGAFQNALVEFATIVLFIPFVIGLAGNVGIQGATVIVRGLATGDIQDDNLHTVIRSELLVGMANGMIFGVLCGTFVWLVAAPLLRASPLLGLTVGSGIFLAVGLASVIGSLTPRLFIRMGIDPAISTGPFVTVLNDISGVAAYLATAWATFTYI
jgi:magnesium transporter